MTAQCGLEVVLKVIFSHLAKSNKDTNVPGAYMSASFLLRESRDFVLWLYSSEKLCPPLVSELVVCFVTKHL